MPKIIIIEDEFFVTNHLKNLINSLGYEVARNYYNGEDFVDDNNWDFDAALIDIHLGKEMTGLEIAEKMKDRNKPFLFLTANQDSITLKKAAKLMPSAYLTKPFQNNDVEAAITILLARVEKRMEYSYQTFLRSNSLTKDPLTSREIDVLKGLVKNQSNPEISEDLFISLNTVKYHTKNIYKKLNVHSKIEIKKKVTTFFNEN
jgi:DNA-binding NarL/FixJ family response regulator